MDISKWKELVRGTSVKIYAGIEMSVYFPAYQSIETIKGFASQYFDTGECFNKKMTFFLGVNKGQSSPTVYVDGKNAPCLGETTDTYAQNAKMLIPKQNRYEAMDFYAYKIEATAGNKREIIVNGNHILLQYVEIKVES